MTAVEQPGINTLTLRHDAPTVVSSAPHIASPYLTQEHLLDLNTLDPQSRLLALALSSLTPARADYATCSYELALNWDHIFTYLASLTTEQHLAWKKQSFYVVEFRSKLKESVDNDLLYALDRQSHREATESGGLLKYWYGSPDSSRFNLATCLWRSREDAVKGGRGPWHQRARAVIPKMYEMIQVKGIVLTIEDEVRDWNFWPIAA